MFPQRRETVALNNYGSAPSPLPDPMESSETYETVASVTTNTTTVIENVESHDNAGFDDSQREDRVEERPGEGERQEMTKVAVDEKPDRKEALINKNRRVRFDLRGVKEKKQRKERRAAMGHIPDIIVISEEAARSGNQVEMDRLDKRRAADEDEEGANGDGDEDMPSDITSVFDDSRKIARGSGNQAQEPLSAHVSAISDEEGTIVDM